MFTVITKGNNVSKHNNPAKLGLIDHDYVVNDQGNIIVNKGNPITWPDSATNGMKAIVDVKAGTLRFGYYDGWPRAATEFVVSTYCDSGTVSAPHIFDLVESWPDQRNREPGLDAPEGWEWKCFGDDWCLSNGFVGLKYDDWFKYKLGDLKPAKSFGAVEDSDPVNRPSHYTAGGIECIDAIKASMSTEAFLGFLKGNVQKYMWRYEKKVAPVEDLKKAQWYLSKLIEEQERS